MSFLSNLQAIHGTAIAAAIDVMPIGDSGATIVTTGGAMLVGGIPQVVGVGDFIINGTLIKAAAAATQLVGNMLPVVTGTSSLTGSPVNLLATGTTTLIGLPIAATRRFLIISDHFVVGARTGTATGNLVFKVGTNVNHDNIIASTTVAAAAFNGVTFSLPFVLSSYPASGGMPTMDVAPVLEITTALTGASVLTGRFGMVGRYV